MRTIGSHRKGFLFGCIIASALLVSACARSSGPRATPPTVYISTPASQEVTGWDSYTGRFEAIHTVEVRPHVSGYIHQVFFHDGEVVRQGVVLFQIDPRPYEADLKQADGRLAQARSELALANENLAPAKNLITSQTIAASLFDQRQQAQRTAQAAHKAAQEVLARAQLNLEFTRVRAPMTGRISRKLVSAGNLVTGGDSGGTLLTTIVSMDPIDIYFYIDEESFLRYTRTAIAHKRSFWDTLGDPVWVALQGDESPTRTGTLNFLDNRLDQSTGTLRARARIPNPDYSLSPGQFGRVYIIGEPAHRALLVPDVAVTTDATGVVLKIVGADERVIVRPVTLGRRFGDLREIFSGLSSDDHVIVSGLQRAQPGDRVMPQSKPLDGTRLASHGSAQ
jgi:RND family efflux transporter MFP subunit